MIRRQIADLNQPLTARPEPCSGFSGGTASPTFYMVYCKHGRYVTWKRNCQSFLYLFPALHNMQSRFCPAEVFQHTS